MHQRAAARRAPPRRARATRARRRAGAPSAAGTGRDRGPRSSASRSAARSAGRSPPPGPRDGPRAPRTRPTPAARARSPGAPARALRRVAGGCRPASGTADSSRPDRTSPRPGDRPAPRTSPTTISRRCCQPLSSRPRAASAASRGCSSTPTPVGGRIARQQQERQRARAAADVEEPAVRRGQEPLEQHGIQAHARAARRLEDADAARPQRVGGDVLSSSTGRPRRRHRPGPGRGAAPSRRYMTQAGRELGEEVRRLLRQHGARLARRQHLLDLGRVHEERRLDLALVARAPAPRRCRACRSGTTGWPAPRRRSPAAGPG